jgi:hypothetical protein
LYWNKWKGRELVKTTRMITLTALFLSLLFGSAWASPMTFTDTYNPTDIYMMNGVTLRYRHNVLNDGFNPLTDTITSAVLSLYLYDDNDRRPETFRIRFDADPSTGPYTLEENVFTFSGDFNPLLDGILRVRLRGAAGDFFFGSSSLSVTADRKTEPVPVPATLLLLGSGLLGIAGIRKRFK